MSYDVLALACEQLSYRDKLRLAQLLIQTARKEEEKENPMNRPVPKVATEKATAKEDVKTEINPIEYVSERLLKLKPVKTKSLINSIKAMFQFQGGIPDADIDMIIAELQKRKFIKIEQNSVSYL